MSEFKNLPSGWKVVRLGDVFEKSFYGTSKTTSINGKYPVLRMGNMQNGTLDLRDLVYIDLEENEFEKYRLHKGDILLNRTNSHSLVDKVSLFDLDGDYLTASYLVAFRPNLKVLNPTFSNNLLNTIRYQEKIRTIATKGVSQSNINPTSFKNIIKIPLPPLDEQKKIAEILSTWDEAINLTINLIESKKQFKKALMQNLLTAKIRFPQFKDEWKETKLGKILKEHKIKSDNKSEVFSVSVHKGIINQIEHLGRSFSAEDTSNYNLVKPFDLVYTKSPTGDFPFGIIKQNLNPFNVIVSPLYGVFESINKFLGTLLHYFFESSIRTNNYLKPIIQKGAKNTINISNDTFLSKSILVPINLNEQQKIAEVLTACDDEINLLNLKLENLKKQKQGLMQKLLSGKVRI